MPLFDLSGSIGGAGSVSGSIGLHIPVRGASLGNGAATDAADNERHLLGGHLSGAGGITGNFQRVLLFSGMPQGVGTLSDGLLMLLGGTVQGVGNVSGTLAHVIGIKGSAFGKGKFALSVPEKLIGVGTLTAYMEVVKVPPPICPPHCCCRRCESDDCDECEEFHEGNHFRDCDRDWRHCHECQENHWEHRRRRDVALGRTRRDRDRHEHERFEDYKDRERRQQGEMRPLREFRWLHRFGRGDLEIFLRTNTGNPVSPVWIGYTIMMVTCTGIMQQIGPTDRRPAVENVGKFYVTGTAGEGGQPGCWAVLWRYQRSYQEPIVEVIEQFTVLDHVLDRDPRDVTLRNCKYGWDL